MLNPSCAATAQYYGSTAVALERHTDCCLHMPGHCDPGMALGHIVTSVTEGWTLAQLDPWKHLSLLLLPLFKRLRLQDNTER